MGRCRPYSLDLGHAVFQRDESTVSDRFGLVGRQHERPDRWFELRCLVGVELVVHHGAVELRVVLLERLDSGRAANSSRRAVLTSGRAALIVVVVVSCISR